MRSLRIGRYYKFPSGVDHVKWHYFYVKSRSHIVTLVSETDKEYKMEVVLNEIDAEHTGMLRRCSREEFALKYYECIYQMGVLDFLKVKSPDLSQYPITKTDFLP